MQRKVQADSDDAHVVTNRQQDVRLSLHGIAAAVPCTRVTVVMDTDKLCFPGGTLWSMSILEFRVLLLECLCVSVRRLGLNLERRMRCRCDFYPFNASGNASNSFTWCLLLLHAVTFTHSHNALRLQVMSLGLNVRRACGHKCIQL